MRCRTNREKRGTGKLGWARPPALALVLAATAAACGSSPPPSRPAPVTTTTSPPTIPSTTMPTTTAPPPSTTTPTTPPTGTEAVPVAPQPSPQQAAAALVSGWATGNRPVALSVSVPSAVATLFAVPYPSGNAVFRGCSSAFPPLVCTYGPPGGGSGGLVEVYVTQVAAGWYVSSVVVET